MTDVVLHVGFQQAGARMLQRALSRLRPQLRRHGIAFVGHRALAKVDGVDGWACDDGADPRAGETFERGVAALVEREQAAVARHRRGGPRTTLVSSDHLLGCANLDQRDERCVRRHAEAALGQVIRALGASRVRLLLYTRRQDRLMELCYLRAVEHGGAHPFGEQFPRWTEPALDYGALLGRLERLPEVDGVRVRPFEQVGWHADTLAGDVLAALGASEQIDLGPVGTDLAPYHLYSHRALEIALDINRFLETERERQSVRRFLTEQFPGTDERSTRVLDDEDRSRVLAAYAPANRRLFEQRMADVPPDAYACDETTAQLSAPVSAPPRRRPGARLLRA